MVVRQATSVQHAMPLRCQTDPEHGAPTSMASLSSVSNQKLYNMPAKMKRIFLWGVAVLIVVLVTFLDIPSTTKFARECQNTGHTIVFGILSVLVLKLLRGGGAVGGSRLLYHYVASFCVALSAGILVEAVQFVSGRDADIYDVVRDVAGIGSFLGGYFVFDRYPVHGPGTYKRLKVLIGVLSAALFLAAMFPITRLAMDYLQRNVAFPVLVDFASTWYLDFVTPHNAIIQVVGAPHGWRRLSGDSVAKITLLAGPRPGFEIEEPREDWTGYTELRFSVFSSNEHPVKLTIRVHDKAHNQHYADRFNRGIDIKRGENRVRIALQDMRSAPDGREMTMNEIAGVMLFATRLEQPIELYVSNIRLE